MASEIYTMIMILENRTVGQTFSYVWFQILTYFIYHLPSQMFNLKIVDNDIALLCYTGKDSPGILDLINLYRQDLKHQNTE